MFSGLDRNGHSAAKQFAWWEQTENRVRGVLGQVAVARHGNITENYRLSDGALNHIINTFIYFY